MGLVRRTRPPGSGRAGYPIGRPAVALVALTLAVGGLVVYKAGAALRALAFAQGRGSLAPKPEAIASGELPPLVRPLAGAASYFVWVGVALGFGVLIAAIVRALVPAGWLARTVAARGPRAHVLAAAIGAPLMLCSCCIAPIFEGVFQRTRRLGPTLALMLAAPALNPAAHLLTFLLFPRSIAIARLLASLALVVLAGAGVGRLAGKEDAGVSACAIETEGGVERSGGLLRLLWSSIREVTARSLPAIVLGVVVSAALARVVPLSSAAAVFPGAIPATLLLAAIALPIALPTFGEIPIGLALLAAGAPASAVVALLVAGVAVNLPSLLTVRRAVSFRAAAATAVAVFLTSAAGGLLAG